MIAETHLQASIDKLGDYLSYGSAKHKNRVEDRSERVGWEAGRNLGLDPTMAEAKAAIKTSAAKGSVEKPIYHLIVSWQSGNEEEGIPPDRPSREEMEWAVDRIREELGLEERYAWMVGHVDTDTPHVHVAIGRVHPRTGRTWSPSYDQIKIYHLLREMEEEKGWHRPAPMTIQEKWETQEESLKYWEETHQKWNRERSVRLWAREEGIAGRIREAGSWREVEESLEGTGAELEPRGEQGMVLKRNGGHVALSSIHSEISRPKLESRFGQTWEEHQRRAYPRGGPSAEVPPLEEPPPSKEASPSKEAPPLEEAPSSEETPVEEAPAEDTPPEDPLLEDPPEERPAEEPPVEDLHAEEETPVEEEMPVEETPPEEAPPDEAPVEEASADEASAGEVPAGEPSGGDFQDPQEDRQGDLVLIRDRVLGYLREGRWRWAADVYLGQSKTGRRGLQQLLTEEALGQLWEARARRVEERRKAREIREQLSPEAREAFEEAEGHLAEAGETSGQEELRDALMRVARAWTEVGRELSEEDQRALLLGGDTAITEDLAEEIAAVARQLREEGQQGKDQSQGRDQSKGKDQSQGRDRGPERGGFRR